MQDVSELSLQAAGRFEFKYRISSFQYHAIRNAITPYMRPDPYTAQSSGGRGYLVRSLYYETDDFDIYAEKMAGDNARVKYRLRTYERTAQDAKAIRVEMKVRSGESLFKHHVFVPFPAYEYFVQHRQWPDTAVNAVQEEFARGINLVDLKPSVLVDYEREGYASRFGEDVRITFDQNVRSAQAITLFPSDPPFFRVHHAYEVVLEIKFRLSPPEWLNDLVMAYGLRRVANSKFTQGIEAGRRDRHYPNGVLVVR